LATLCLFYTIARLGWFESLPRTVEWVLIAYLSPAIYPCIGQFIPGNSVQEVVLFALLVVVDVYFWTGLLALVVHLSRT
jgi:hypothetical protein